MMSVFADTSFFVALINERDRHHEVADRLGRELKQPIVTTQWELLELGNYFANSRYREIASQLIESIPTDTRIECVPVNEESFWRGQRLYGSRPDKQWSLTDCISFETMRDRAIHEALTADHHFEQAGYDILLK